MLYEALRVPTISSGDFEQCQYMHALNQPQHLRKHSSEVSIVDVGRLNCWNSELGSICFHHCGQDTYTVPFCQYRMNYLQKFNFVTHRLSTSTSQAWALSAFHTSQYMAKNIYSDIVTSLYFHFHRRDAILKLCHFWEKQNRHYAPTIQDE